jgi:hypothetical protein
MFVAEVGCAIVGVVALASWLFAKLRKRKPPARIRKQPVQVSNAPSSPSITTHAKVQVSSAATLFQRIAKRLRRFCRPLRDVAERVRRFSVRAALRTVARVLDYAGLVAAGLHHLLCPLFKPSRGESGPFPQTNESEWRRLPFQKLGAPRNKDTLVPSSLVA